MNSFKEVSILLIAKLYLCNSECNSYITATLSLHKYFSDYLLYFLFSKVVLLEKTVSEYPVFRSSDFLYHSKSFNNDLW